MTFPGEKLVIRLWETLADKGIGGVLKPLQIKREGMAHLEVRRAELLALAQTQKDVEDILAGRKGLEDLSEKVIIGPKAALADFSKRERIEPTIDLPTIIDTSARRILTDAARREINVAKAVIHAEAELKDDAQEPPQSKVNDDWLFRWRDYAGDVSSEELQSIWGRLLAGELKSPGSYSLRALEFIRNLASQEASEIAKLSRFVIADVIWKADESPLEAEGITFSFLLKMQDLGIVSGVEAIGLNVTWKTLEAGKFSRPLCSHGKVLRVTHADPAKHITLSIYNVTDIGRQILRLGTFEPHDAYLRLIGKAILNQGFDVTIGQYRRVSETRIQILNEEKLAAQPTVQPDGSASGGSAGYVA